METKRSMRRLAILPLGLLACVNRAKTSTTSRGALDATGTNESGWAADRRVDITLND